MRRLVRPVARRLAAPTDSLASFSASSLVLLYFLVFSLLLTGAAADSRQRNPLRSISRVEDPVLHAPSHRVHALSTFQVSFVLHQTGTNRRLPVRLRLEPNHNILADEAAIHHVDENGNIIATEPINRLDHRVFMGHAFVQSGHSLVAGNPNANHWINAGWASLYVQVDGERPVFEGSFHLAGDNHHIQTSRNYLDTRLPDDPLIAPEANEYMVVWRDSDVVPDASLSQFHLEDYGHDELRRLRLRSETDGNATIDSASLLSQATCSSDGLSFNTDDMHPIYRGISVENAQDAGIGSRFKRTVDSLDADIRWLFGRQIDGTGTNGGGNSAGVNLSSSIGNPSGCPTTRKVALMGVAADCNYVNAFPTKANASNNIITQINSASRVYENTFNITLGIQNLFIQNASCPAQTASSATPWNAECSSNLTITDRLNLFSKWRGASANDSNALWMLMSTCSDNAAVGLAWLGQLCVPGSQENAGTNETVAATNVVVRTSTEWQVMAHEIGHTFGAVHDCVAQTCADGTVTRQQCCPLSATSCNANSQFIMNPSTGTGITQFSSCTLGNICSAMGRNSVKSSCLSNNRNVVTVTGAVCGNGIVEAGEECDCGGTQGCGSNSCCDPTTCKFTTNALCDPSNDECCTASCQLASAGTVCRPSTGSCDPAETCSGTTAACPADVTTPDGTSCGASGSGLACASGQCTSRDLQCKTLMGSLTTNNDTYACSSQGCQLSCASPEFGSNTCLMMNQNFLDGTPCEGGGHCSNGNCEDVSLAKEIAGAFRNNLDIVIPVSVVVGILFFLAIGGCIWSFIKRHRRRRRLRELAQSGMPMPPPPPPRRGWFGNGNVYPNASGGYGAYGGAFGARNVPPYKPEEASPAVTNARPSRWAFWAKKRPNGSAGNNSNEAIGMASMDNRGGPNNSNNNNNANNNNGPSNIPSVEPWRRSGYGGGPEGFRRGGGPGSNSGVETPPPPYTQTQRVPAFRQPMGRFA